MSFKWWVDEKGVPNFYNERLFVHNLHWHRQEISEKLHTYNDLQSCVYNNLAAGEVRVEQIIKEQNQETLVNSKFLLVVLSTILLPNKIYANTRNQKYLILIFKSVSAKQFSWSHWWSHLLHVFLLVPQNKELIYLE